MSVVDRWTALVVAVFAVWALVLLFRRDSVLKAEEPPNAHLLIHDGEPRPTRRLRRRHGARNRWTELEYARLTNLDALRGGHPSVRPQPAPSRAAFINPSGGGR